MTAMRQVASDELGIKLEDITSISNDTATAPYGFGTFASRTAVFGSGATIKAARELRQRILVIGAFLLQVPIEELTITNSVVHTVDRSKSIALKDLTEKSYFSAKSIPQEINPGFEVTAFYDPKFGSFAGGRPYRGGGRGSENWPSGGLALRRRGGCRHADQSRGGRRADHRRHRPRHWRGVAGGIGV